MHHFLLQAMEIVLNEISFTALLGSVILFTLTCANLVKSGRGQQQQQEDAADANDPKDKAEENKVASSQSGLRYRRASSAQSPTSQRKVGGSGA